MTPDDLNRVFERFESSPDAAEPREIAGLFRSLVELHRSAIEKVLEIASEYGGADLLQRFREDPLIESVLRGHELIPPDLTGQVKAAIDSVRPALRARGADVMLVTVNGGVAQLEIIGAGRLSELKTLIRDALSEQVPELEGVRIGSATYSLGGERPRRWIPVMRQSELEPERLSSVRLFDEEILVGLSGTRVFAVRTGAPEGKLELLPARMEAGVVRVGI